MDVAREEEPDLFDDDLVGRIYAMVDEAVECEAAFAEDVLAGGVGGMSLGDMREYLEYIADRRLVRLGLAPRYGARNPFAFMEFQDVPELANFFERRVSAYQTAVAGSVHFGEDF